MDIPSWVIPVAIVAVVLVLVFLTGYRKARPDQALIISGLRRKAKVVIGKAAVKLPFLERCDVLDLALMSVDVRTQTSIPSGGIRLLQSHVQSPAGGNIVRTVTGPPVGGSQIGE